VEVWRKAVAFPIPAEARFGMLNALRFKILNYLGWLSSTYRAEMWPDRTDEAIGEITRAARQLKSITGMLPQALRRHNTEYLEQAQEERRLRMAKEIGAHGLCFQRSQTMAAHKRGDSCRKPQLLLPKLSISVQVHCAHGTPQESQWAFDQVLERGQRSTRNLKPSPKAAKTF
jgi:hypothetical protein